MSASATPRVFRVLLAAKDLAQSRKFYETLLGIPGRAVAEGRIYFDCGAVTLGVLDFSAHGPEGFPAPTEAVYFAVPNLEEVHRRAKALGGVSRELLHDDPSSPLGEIVVRPWGERSFYVEDPSGNSLCFVDEKTLFTGTPEQIARLRGTSNPSRRSR